MEIEVLGPLAAAHNGTSFAPTAGKPRTVLAMLALHAGSVVTVDQLITELWPHGRPRSAKTIVQTYILSLRNRIARCRPNGDSSRAAAKGLLATLPGGYQLNAPEARIDVVQFEKFACAGHRAREIGDFIAASRAFSDALTLWRGGALMDVQRGPHLDVDVQRLEEARLNVLDCRIDADLRLGRHHELLGELSALVSQYRTHEGLCAHLMLALYRSGRRDAAVNAYGKLHTCLIGELGLEPSAPLRRLHRTMLASGRDTQDLDTSWHEATTEGRHRIVTGDFVRGR
ncbi:AfsR/SARP family transcriptional regulator [Actinoplanes xinjiangensis]|uniref:AfsR/SARP family transcriptional regulator n=1 Tax=Actinoplanes xinjiangensis TaxID=512350 RepID=UPI00342EC3F3